jgi:protein MpaA
LPRATPRQAWRTIVAARLLAGLFVGAGSAGAAAAASPEFPLMSVDRACERIGQRLQSVDPADCRRANFHLGDGASRLRQALLYKDFPAHGDVFQPRRVLLIGGIHGDEFSSVSMVFQWMRKLEQERIQPFYWRVIPSANPDGLFANPATRENRAGVDLNRNFPSADWNKRALAYWRSKAGSDKRRFPGKSAMSEPETRWLVAQIESFKPDAIVSVHAPYGVLDYDGPLRPPERFGYLRLQPLGVYPGSLGNYAGVDHKLPVITLELPNAGIMPTAAQSQRIWTDMLNWLARNLPRERPPLYERLDDEVWLNQPRDP